MVEPILYSCVGAVAAGVTMTTAPAGSVGSNSECLGPLLVMVEFPPWPPPLPLPVSEGASEPVPVCETPPVLRLNVLGESLLDESFGEGVLVGAGASRDRGGYCQFGATPHAWPWIF